MVIVGVVRSRLVGRHVREEVQEAERWNQIVIHSGPYNSWGH
jgi:hypothetical protein